MTSKNPIVQKALNATTKTYDPNRRPSVIVGEINRKCPKLSAKVDAWFVWVEFRDKKGVKGRLPDAIMAEPGFPRDKLEVARVDADGVMFTVKGNPYVNAAKTVKNAAYSSALKYILDSVKPYMDKRIKGDSSWRYPMLVITVLRKVCDKAIMSAGRYDGKRPPHRIYDIECVKDGFKFQGNLIITGLLHRDDPDDVSAFDEYDMTLSLMNVGKATNAVNAKFAVTTKSGRSVVIEAPNYKAAEKEAKRRFGAGCIVDLVGNSVAANFNYKNKYQWFVVTPSMSGACILAGNEYREDAQEVFKEIKDEEGISCKVVARRTLERAGIDPNVSESWAKGIRKAVANAKFKEGQRVVEIPSKFGSMGTGTIEWCEDDPKEPQRARVRFDKGGTWVMDIRHLRAANANASTANDTSKAKNSTRNYEMKSTNPIVQKALNSKAVNGSDDAILRLCKPSNIIQRGKTENLHEVRFGVGYIYPVVSRDGVLVKVYGSLSEANRRALNREAANAVAKNANEPLIRYIKSNIQTKFPQSSLEGYTDGVTSLIERGNGKITILADRKARPALDQLKAKFEPDYIFAFVDYGRGKTGFTMTPRAHTQRGEFKVANAVVTNALAKKQLGNVTAYLYKGLAGISVNSISHQAEGDAPKDCVASAKAMLADYEKAVAGIKNAIAWMSAL